MTDTKIVLIREGGLVVSVTNDLVTFGCLAAAFWFNMNYIGGSYVFNAIIALCFFLMVMSKGMRKTKTFRSYDEAIAHLNELKNS